MTAVAPQVRTSARWRRTPGRRAGWWPARWRPVRWWPARWRTRWRSTWGPSVRAGAVAAGAGYLGWVTITVLLLASGAVGRHGRGPSWRQWDAVWYELIAERGYRHAGTGPEQSTAFFPLYPMIVRLVDTGLPGDAAVAGVAVSALAYPAALAVLHRLAAVEFDETVAARVVWTLAALPTAFFLGVGYNMSLALLLTVGCGYTLRRQRWWLAGALGALSTANRFSALLLLAVFAVEYVRRIGLRASRYLLVGAMIPAGLLGYTGYLWATFGDPLLFTAAQRQWGRHLDWPWAGVARAVRLALSPATGADLRLFNALDVVAVGLLVTVLVLGARSVRPDQWSYPLLGLGWWTMIVTLPSSDPHLPVLTSAGRLTLEVYPAFLLLAIRPTRPVTAALLLVAALLTQAVLCALFVLGYWAG